MANKNFHVHDTIVGPINSWDREPFMTDLWNDGEKSFVPVRRRISFNLITANYGAAEGVDNDDGSSWYHVFRNVFYDAEGFKMDYGGHDSIYEDNLVISYPTRNRRHGGAHCIDFDHFLPNHGHIVRRNRCVVPNAAGSPLIQLGLCKNGHAVLQNNTYFTASGDATLKCGYRASDLPISFAQAQQMYGLELGSRVLQTPECEETLLKWALETLLPDISTSVDVV